MGVPLIPYGRQTIDEEDIAEVVRVLRSDWLTTGPEVEAFERELAAACGARFAVVVSSGTAALHCAYAACGVGADDEVVTSPLTFSATANMVLALGGKPVFADVLPDTLGLDPVKAEAALTPRTKVLAPVDFAGHPAEMDAFMALGRRHGLRVVEDAAHSIGARLGGRPVGALADLTTFSFHPVKTITSGEGGAVLTDDEELAERVRAFRSHGIVREPARWQRRGEPDEHRDGPWYHEVQSLGFNYRLTDVQCALGRSQLRKLEGFIARRAAIVARYRAAFAGLPLRPVAERAGAAPGWHLFAVLVEGGPAKRAAFFTALRERGIGPQVHYIAANDMPLYRALGHRPEDTPIALDASRRLVSLPLYPGLGDEDVERVISAVHSAAAVL